MTDNDSVIDDLIQNIHEQPGAADLLVGLIAQRMRETNADAVLRQSEHYIQQRWLNNGVPVTDDSTGLGRDVLGTAEFDTVNVIGGTATVEPTNPRQVNFAAGAGADCMFDYLVSPCFATLRGFTEGQTFTTLSGCTFKGYSTVAGASTAASAAFASTTPAVIYICKGTYAETFSYANGLTSRYQIWVGAGKEATIIGGATSSSDTVVMAVTGSRLWIRSLTIKPTSAGNGIYQQSGGGVSIASLDIDDCRIYGNTTALEFGVRVDAIVGGQSGVAIRNSEIIGGYGIYVVGNLSGHGTAQIVNNRFVGCTLGVAMSMDVLCSNNMFTGGTTEVLILDASGHGVIEDNHFDGSTTCIASSVGATVADTFTYGYIVNNEFDDVATFIDFSGIGTGVLLSNYGQVIRGNHGSLSVAFMKLPPTGGSSGPHIKNRWVVKDNWAGRSSGSPVFYSGPTDTHPSWTEADNFIALSGPVSSGLMPMEPVHPGIKRGLTGDIWWHHSSITIGVVACTVSFGDTDIQVTRQTLLLTASATNYVQISSAGVLQLSSTPTTAYDVGTYHIGVFVTTTTGIDSYTPGTPLMNVASGPSGSGTLDGIYLRRDGTTPLTGKWDQSGAFDIVQRGGDLLVANSKQLKLYSDNSASPSSLTGAWDATTGRMAVGMALNATRQVNITGTFLDTTASNGINLTHNPRRSASDAATQHTAMDILMQPGATAGSWSFTGTPGVVAQRNLISVQSAGGTIAVVEARNISAELAIAASQSVTTRSAYYVKEASGAGTLTNQYGLYIEALTKGGTLNYGLYSLAPDRHGNRVEFDGISAPATPASDDIVLYNPTGTDTLKVTTDNADVFNLTHLHVVHLLVDGTVTTQKTPGPPMPHAGKITNIFLKTADGVTVGATAAIVQIYKVLAANVNTDGGTTSIFTTAPTITNGNMRQNYGPPDLTTTFAAGDVLVAANTQVGTNVTFIACSATVEYT